MQQLISANILRSQSSDQCFRSRHTHEDPYLCNHNFTARLYFNGFVLCHWRFLSLWSLTLHLSSRWVSTISWETEFEGILPKGPYPPCLRMADKAPLARCPRIMVWYLYFTCQLTTHSAVCMDAHDDDVARPMGHTMHPLINLPLDKMAAILADDIFKCIFLNENDKIMIQISLKFIPRSPIDNKSVLVQVMAWRRTGDKPLPETMMTQFTDAYMRH